MKSLANKSILVVDDDVRWLRAMDKVLTGEGVRVTRAQWAGEALDVLTVQKTPVDLLITDLRMPCVTGLTVVYSVRKMFPQMPVIVLTAFGSPDVRAECLRLGAAAFLEKPVNSSEMLGAIEWVFASQAAGIVPPKPVSDGEHVYE